MKKALTIISLIGSSISYALAHVVAGDENKLSDGTLKLTLFGELFVPFVVSLYAAVFIVFLFFFVKFIRTESSDLVKKKKQFLE